MESYENKLELLVKFEARTKLLEQLQQVFANTSIPDPQRAELQKIVRELQALD